VPKVSFHACGRFVACFLCAVAGGWNVSGAQVAPRKHAPVHATNAQPSQTTVQAVPADISAALLDMASRAGVIFAGQVISVARNDSAGFVDVRFHVAEAVLGSNAGGIYVLREWAGLWSGEPERYRAGQSLLLFLSARGPSGMSSPVNGSEGIVPLLATAQEPIADALGNVPADDGLATGGMTSMTVDLRWVQTGVARATVSAGYSGRFPSNSAGVHAASAGAAVPVLGDPGPVSPVPAPSPGPGLGSGAESTWMGPFTALPLDAAQPGNAGALPPSLGAVLTLLRGDGAGTQVRRAR
jgi:hypothetical protein